MADQGTNRRRPGDGDRRADGRAEEGACRSPERDRTLSPKEQERLLADLKATGIELERRNDELRQALTRLQALQARYGDMYDLAPVGLLTVSEEGSVLEGNAAAVALLGVARSDLVGQRLAAYVLPEDLETYGRCFAVSFAADERRECEVRMLRAGGDPCWVRLEAAAARSVEGAAARRVVMSDITGRRKAEDRLRTERKHLRSLASQLSAAEERERRRLAATLHEHVGQLLAVVRIRLVALREDAGAAGLADRLDEIRSLVDEVLEATRTLTSEIAPPVLYRVGLEAAIEWYGERLMEASGLAVRCVQKGTPWKLGDELRGFLFSAARELLHNVVKHAHVGVARVLLDWRDEAIMLAVEDDGTGFEPEAGDGEPDAPGCFGLFSIRERADDLGGWLEVASAPGRGTRASLVIPRGAPGPGGTVA